jgi:hypothetical protein
MEDTAMTPRERIQRALSHREPDRVPRDLGGSAVTGAHCTVVYALRQALGLDPPGTPVKVTEPYQMLGELAPDLLDALGIDVVGLGGPRTLFGFENRGWKEWTFWDGTPLLVPEAFNTTPEPSGDVLMYPEGDRSAPPSGRLPVGGYYFDTIIRQDPIDEDRLDPMDNLEEFGPISDADLAHFAREAASVAATGRGVLASFGGTAFGDIALVPAPFLKRPRGIRDVAEWYISTRSRRDYVYRVFELQCEVALANLAKIRDVVGDVVDAVFLTGTDFGTQRGLFISVGAYRDLYKPFHRAVNDWVHRNTPWKTFIHSCGSVAELIPDFIEAGFDVLNPVQCSAAGMDPRVLKERFGDRITFWGGGVDTQQTLPFGTPDQVRAEVAERVRTFGPGGGFVFNPIHNIQARTPVENLLAMFETLDRESAYPL